MTSEADRPVALITGASRGIGAATARLLAARGYALVLAARSEAALTALAAGLAAAAGVPVAVVPTDVRSAAALRHLADAALARFGRVDVLLHNAGVVHPGVLVAELDDEQVAAVLQTNLLAPIELTRALLPAMLGRGSGWIGFVSSVGGQIALPSAAMYSATKAGMDGFAHALRREVGGRGIAVSVISPGFVRTRLTEEVERLFGGLRLPMDRPETVARAILRSIDRRRPRVIVPVHNVAFIWLERNAPWLMDIVAGLYLRRVLARARAGAPPQTPPGAGPPDL
jgi:short-subunit dehydrogenase